MPQNSDHTPVCTLRLLTSEEIAQLEANHCSATDWSLIFVPEKFTPTAYQFVEFKGELLPDRILPPDQPEYIMPSSKIAV